MSTERMSCCGALTKTYADAGERQHEPDCPTLTGRLSERDPKQQKVPLPNFCVPALNHHTSPHRHCILR